jgi:hypothetical protein
LTLAQYCRKHRVGESTFRQYQGKLPSIDSKRKAKTSPTLPRMVRLLPAASQAPLAHGVEIQFANGILMRLAQLDPSTLNVLRPLLCEILP